MAGVSADIEHASDGEQALHLLSAERFDLVFLDINMPRFNGDEVLERLGGKLTSPVVVLSSSDESPDVLNALAHGASASYRKPLSLDEYLATVARIAERFLGANRSSAGA